ncbi:MAG: hypothetical protein JWO67_4861 [Streptosporangiaceae bacterium]|nr:hypothetical protein [Streptosporangiaceae bacterium]
MSVSFSTASQTTKAFVGRNVQVCVDQFDVSVQFHEAKHKREAGVVDATGFGATVEYALAAVQKASLEVKGYYAPDSQLDDIMVKRLGQGADVLGVYAPLGWNLGNPIVMQPSVLTKYDLDAKTKGGVDIDVTMMARGAIDDGKILLSPNVYTSSSGTSAVLDNTTGGGQTNAGGSAQLHVFGIDTTATSPSLTAKVQHSVDMGTTWTDLFVFPTITVTNGAYRLVLPKQQPVGAMVRASWVVSGTGATYVALLGFCRGIAIS